MHDGAVEPDGSGGDEPCHATSEESSAVRDVYDTRPCLRGLSKEDLRSTRLAWLVANNKMSAEVAEGASETDIARAWRRPQLRNRRVVNFQSWNNATRRLFQKNKVFRAWQQQQPSEDRSWDAFNDGPWQRIAKQKRRRKTRNHSDEWARVLLPCETAAIDSTRQQPAARSKHVLLDRMPSRARADPLTSSLSIFETFTRQTDTREVRDRVNGGTREVKQQTFVWMAAPVPGDGNGNGGVDGDSGGDDGGADGGDGVVGGGGNAAMVPTPREPTKDEWIEYRGLCQQNVTCFTTMEESHPINFFEQRDVCSHCGCERFTTTAHKQCCQDGLLKLVRTMPASLLSLISESPGLSKQSRAANDLFRLAQMALPKGTHRIPDSYQHLKVTGVPFAIVPNLNERSSTRSFLDDPYERLETRNHFESSTRPSDAAIAIINEVLNQGNALVRELVNWSEASTTTARLVLKWPGTTTSVRAFTVDPTASIKEPRTVFFTRLDEDEPCYIRTDSPGYAPLMWPLAFPDGQPAQVRSKDSEDPDELRNLDDVAKNLQQATLALMHQPEVRGDGTFVYVPTVSPYDASLPPVLRRFSRLELMGRLGDEILVDRWLSVLDARLRMVAKEWMQRRLLGRFEDRGADEPETDGDAAAERHGTYLPASEIGTPRHLRQCCSNAMAALRQLGCQYLLFITFTTDISGDWPEVSSRLAFPSQTKRSAAQDPFDRAALHAEVFEAKVQAFLARLRSGSIFRNLGRPTLRTEQWADATGTMKTRRIYEYPMATAGGGFLICAVEDQDRGLGHIHIAYKPARAPKESWNAKPRPGVHMPWVDELLCARIPDERVLEQFKMVLPASEARAMLGVCGRDGTPHGKYAYLRDVPDDVEVLHPDIVADFGYGLTTTGTYDHSAGKTALLSRLVKLVSGTPRTGTESDPKHWSLHPYVHPGGGKLIHKHHGGPDVPDAWCKRKGQSGCKDRYPKDVSAYTHMTEEGYILHERGLADVMVVPYNPWIMLYFTSHINVEFVCSPTNVVLYLFKIMKYILKGSDVNRLQLVVDGAEQRGNQGSADGSTHQRDQRPDEIRQWRNAKTTCAPQAYRRMAGHITYLQEPTTLSACVHEPRERDADDRRDDGLSDWELYLARPLLSELDDMKFESFLRTWLSGSSEKAPRSESATETISDAEREAGVVNIAKDGRRVYCMNDRVAIALRANTPSDRLKPRYYWKRTDQDAKECVVRVLRVPMNAGVRYYVRLLSKHVAARSYEDLRRDPTNPLLIHESFELACRKRGLLVEETEARQVIEDAMHAGDTGSQLRSLIAHFLHEGFPLAEVLEDGSLLGAASSDTAGSVDAAYADIDERLGWLGTSLAKYAPHVPCAQLDEVTRERQVYVDHGAQRALADSADLMVDTKPGPAEQSEVISWGLRGARDVHEPPVLPEMLATIVSRPPTQLEVARLQAAAGYGKTRTVKRLLAELRARGQLALATASTNLAATNYERGMSTHALALLVGDGVDDNNNVTIRLGRDGRMTPERLALLRACDLIVIDEDSSLPCTIAEALLIFLEEHKCAVRVLFVGDREQIPPVVVNGSREEVVEASVLSSLLHLFANKQEFLLTKPYRQRCATWARFVRSVGAGTAEAMPDHALSHSVEGRQAIAMPLVRRVYHERDPDVQRVAIEALFGVDANGCLDVSGGFRAILCTRNDVKDEWNELVNERRRTDTEDAGRTYIASHRTTIEHGGDDGDAMAAEALGEDDMANFQNVDHSVPLSELTLRVGDVMLLAKTIDKVAGLVKNARVTIVTLRWNAAVVRLDRSDGPSATHTVGRARFSFGLKRNSPLKIVRTQLPLVHAWALTINRSQGQTLEGVLLDLRRPAFSHGHANVAISRVHVADDLGVFVNDSCCVIQDDGTRCAVLGNVVYEELLAPASADRCVAIANPAPTTKKRIRLADLVALLDDPTKARRKRDSVEHDDRMEANSTSARATVAPATTHHVQPPLAVARPVLDAKMTATDLEVLVEATLNKLFAGARDDVPFSELYRDLLLKEPRVAQVGRKAVEETLVHMEAANKVMHREGRVYLI